MPREPPVTSATWPFRSGLMVMVSSLLPAPPAVNLAVGERKDEAFSDVQVHPHRFRLGEIRKRLGAVLTAEAESPAPPHGNRTSV